MHVCYCFLYKAFLADIHKGCDKKRALPQDFTSNILEVVDMEIFNKLRSVTKIHEIYYKE